MGIIQIQSNPFQSIILSLVKQICTIVHMNRHIMIITDKLHSKLQHVVIVEDCVP